MAIPQMMKLREASKVCGISYYRLREWCISGKVANVKAGRDWLINMSDLSEYLNNSGKKLANDAD